MNNQNSQIEKLTKENKEMAKSIEDMRSSIDLMQNILQMSVDASERIKETNDLLRSEIIKRDKEIELLKNTINEMKEDFSKRFHEQEDVFSKKIDNLSNLFNKELEKEKLLFADRVLLLTEKLGSSASDIPKTPEENKPPKPSFTFSFWKDPN